MPSANVPSASTGLGGAECRHHGQSSRAATAGEVARIQILRGQSTTRTACESPRRFSEAKGGARKETPQSLRPTHVGSTAPQGPGVGCPCDAATQRQPGPRMRPLPQPPSHLPLLPHWYYARLPLPTSSLSCQYRYFSRAVN